MKYAVVWDSKTGNTRVLGESLVCELVGLEEAELLYAGPLCASDGSVALSEAVLADVDVIFFGFWCDKGDCTPEAAAFLNRLGSVRVFLYGTAGFGGSAEYFRRILDRVEGHLSQEAQLIGDVMCQGKMDISVRKRFEKMLKEKPGDARTLAMVENFDEALGHPNAVDTATVALAARQALEA